MSVTTHASPIALPREGPRFKNIYRISEEGIIHDIDAKSFNILHHIDGVIRIPDDAYDAINIQRPFYSHFNLEFSGHKIGKLYAFARILKNGYFRTENDEVPPVLSFGGVYTAECISVREHVPYEVLEKKDLAYAMQNITSADDLRKVILLRYGISMPGLTKEEILARGVSITTLKMVGRFA